MRFVFIRAHERLFHVTTMCRVLEVSRAGFYKWRAQPLSERVKADLVLAARIRAIHTGRQRSYGSPRVHRELQDQGVRCGEKRVARVMRLNGIRAVTPKPYRVTTQSSHRQPVAPNHLGASFQRSHPGRPECGVGRGHYLHPDAGRLALPRRHPRSRLTAHRGLERAAPVGSRARAGRPPHSAPASRGTRWAPSLRSRRAVRQYRLSPATQ